MPKRKRKYETKPNIKLQSLISLEDPLADYQQLIHANKQQHDDDRMLEEFYEIANAARTVVWQLLFGTNINPGALDLGTKHNDGNRTGNQLIQAVKLLREHRSDVCFLFPWHYNEWIMAVRQELKRRGMYNFWRYALVKNELGPCWLEEADVIEVDAD